MDKPPFLGYILRGRGDIEAGIFRFHRAYAIMLGFEIQGVGLYGLLGRIYEVMPAHGDARPR